MWAVLHQQGKEGTYHDAGACYRFNPIAAVAGFGLHILQLLPTKIYVLHVSVLPSLKCMHPCTACGPPCTFMTYVHSLCIFWLRTSVKERIWLSWFSAATTPWVTLSNLLYQWKDSCVISWQKAVTQGEVAQIFTYLNLILRYITF